MAISILQSPTPTQILNSAGPTASFSACTNPSLLVVICSVDHRTTTMSVSGSVNGAYTQDEFINGGAGQPQAGGGSVGIFSFQNRQTAGETITVSLSAATYGFITLLELSGVHLTSAKDASATTISTTGSSYSLGVTTASDNCAIVTQNAHYSTGQTTDSGFTSFFAETVLDWSYHYGEYDLDVGAAGLKTLTHGSYTSVSAHTGAAVSYAVAPAGDPSTGFIINTLRPGLFKPGIAR